MARGAPDWGFYAPKATIATVQDMGELAVRLGSIDSFDRRGDVILLDDFENGILRWDTSSVGVGGGVVSSSTYARSGGYSCRLTTGDAVGDTATIYRGVGYPALSRVGLEISLATGLSPFWFYSRLYVANGVTAYDAEVRYRDVEEDLQINALGLGWVSVAAGREFFLDYNHFHTLKLVANFTTGKYVRAIFDDLLVDLSAYSVPNPADTGAPRLRVIIKHENRGPVLNQVMFLDDFILTQNEP